MYDNKKKHLLFLWCLAYFYFVVYGYMNLLPNFSEILNIKTNKNENKFVIYSVNVVS